MTEITRAHLAGRAFNYLSEHLSYDSDTGSLKWICRSVGMDVFGKEAGSIRVNTASGKQYREIRINGHTYQAHRIAWTLFYGEPPLSMIDHINGDGMDNRISNLREVDPLENSKNARLRKDNKLGITGVSTYKKDRFCAYIKCDRKDIHLGYFDDIFSAACARKSAEVRYGFHKNHGTVRPL